MIELGLMTRADLDEVCAIEEESFSTPWSRESISSEIVGNKIAIYIVAKEEGRVLGYAGMWHVVTEGHITNIAVAPSQRRRGIGDMLLMEMIRIATERQMIGITLEVRMGNRAAMQLYAKHGFKAEGIRKKYYRDTGEDAVIMWKYIN